MLAASRAETWAEFRTAIARFKVPSENMVYADRDGNIGFAVAGAAPIRKNWTGLLPAPGTGEFEWGGYIRSRTTAVDIQPAEALRSDSEQQHSSRWVYKDTGIRVGAAIPYPAH